MTDVVMGIDVSLRRGLDVVVLDADHQIVDAQNKVTTETLPALLKRWRPATVAIDSPPGPGRRATARDGELALNRLGIKVYYTPSDPERFARPFYDWVREGMKAFAIAARAGYPTQADPDVVRGHALEVFPHASDVCFRGHLPPAGVLRHARTKRDWRLETLRSMNVPINRLPQSRVGPTMDAIDATLAALTARCALKGNYTAIGGEHEWIVVPGQPTTRFARLAARPLRRQQGG